jgi:hypothetical protein
MRVQEIARVCERIALLPLVALAIELLALLRAYDSTLTPTARLLLVGIAAAAFLVTLIRSVRLLKQQRLVSVLCIAVSVFCIVVGVGAIVPVPGISLTTPQHGWAFLRTAHRSMPLNIKKLDKDIASEVHKHLLSDPQSVAAQVPEPSVWVLLALAGVALVGSRRLRRPPS